MFEQELECGIKAVLGGCSVIRDVLASEVNDLAVLSKSSNRDMVTEADKQGEKRIRSIIAQTYPDHLVIGEETFKPKPTDGSSASEKDESGASLLTDAPTWIIDPVDGTTNLVYGIPYFSVLLALKVRKSTVVGIVFDLSNGELFYATAGGGAWLRKVDLGTLSLLGEESIQRLNCNKERLEVSQAMVVMDVGYSREAERVQVFTTWMSNLLTKGKACSLRILGSCGLDLAYLAAGRIDVYIHTGGIMIWDTAAGVLLIKEAGGTVLDLDGSEFQYRNRRMVAAATKDLSSAVISMNPLANP
mmetsp:Transcript_1270/g.1377  ORF Transcript_1270/g.1377 Transcript_1270/m.1377 type:complete len:302 (-) Transcript_1270:60-965(-)